MKNYQQVLLFMPFLFLVFNNSVFLIAVFLTNHCIERLEMVNYIKIMICLFELTI